MTCARHSLITDTSCAGCAANTRNHDIARTAAATEQSNRIATAARYQNHRDLQVVQALQQKQLALQSQQVEIAQYTAHRQDLYQVAMWRQSSDGVVYLQWCADALPILARLEVLNDYWEQGWIEAVKNQIAGPLEAAQVGLAKPPVPKMLAIVGGVFILLSIATQGFLYFGLLLLVTALVAVIVQGNATRAALSRRVSVFGFDPLNHDAIPLWSGVNSQGGNNRSMSDSIGAYLIDGGKSFPVASQLPLLQLPPMTQTPLPAAMHGTWIDMAKVLASLS